MNFTNPLYKRKAHDGAPLSQADPYIIEHNGTYYIYATGQDGVSLYSGTDFNNLEYRGICLSENNCKEFWAPSVIFIDAKFYMYYSCMNKLSDDVHTQAIRVAVSDKPEGPFEFVKVLLEPFSIDAHVVNTGTGLYMFYSVNDYEADRAGTYIVLDKMTGPLNMEGNPVTAIKPTLDEEIFERDRFKKGQHWHTIEGAFYFREGDWHYITYSGSAYTCESYFIGYASAPDAGEKDLREVKFTKRPAPDVYAPLIAKGGGVEGTGHNSVIKCQDGYYIVYHARDDGNLAKHGDTDSRVMRAGRLTVKDGALKAAESDDRKI